MPQVRVKPVNEDEVEVLESCILPFGGSIASHDPETSTAIVQVPDNEAYLALAETPNYEFELIAEESEKSHTEAENNEQEDSSKVDVISEDTSKYSETKEPETKEPEPKEPETKEPEIKTFQDLKAAVAEDSSKNKVSSQCDDSQDVFLSLGPKRTPLSSNDAFYLITHVNILGPCSCIFLIGYTFLSICNLCY